MKKAALLLILILRVAHAQEWSWTEHAYPEDGFRAEFNAPVTIQPMRLQGEGSDQVVRGTRYMIEERRRVYVVAASLTKGGVNLDKGAHDSFALLQCGTALSDTPFEAPWGRGREVRARHCVDGTYRAEARY